MHACVPILVVCFLARVSSAADVVTVFAAASTTNAVSDLARTYEARTGVKIVTSFAGSSTLARQIENGAPADIFISADLKWMDYLVEKRLIDTTSRVDLLGNALVVIAPAGKGFAFTVGKGFAAETAFAGRMALGDPTNVPVGIYAKEAFTNLGWWSWLEKRIAPTADVRAALKLVELGEVDCGVVYATDARTSTKVEVIAAVPVDLHQPTRYPFAATVGASRAAQVFLSFLTGAEAKPVYEGHGFTVLR